MPSDLSFFGHPKIVFYNIHLYSPSNLVGHANKIETAASENTINENKIGGERHYVVRLSARPSRPLAVNSYFA